MLRIEYLKHRLQESSVGQSILAMMDVHGEELGRLFLKNRAVVLVWNRNHGPEFIAKGLEGAAHNELYVVREVNGVTVETLLRRTVAAMMDYASEELAGVMSRSLGPVLQWLGSYGSLSEILEGLGGQASISPTKQEDSNGVI